MRNLGKVLLALTSRRREHFFGSGKLLVTKYMPLRSFQPSGTLFLDLHGHQHQIELRQFYLWAYLLISAPNFDMNLMLERIPSRRGANEESYSPCELVLN